MMQKRWFQWAAVLVGLIFLGEGAGWLLTGQGHEAAGGVVRMIGRGFAAFWIVWGLYRQRDFRWARVSRWMVLCVYAIIGLAWPLWRMGSYGMAFAVGGVFAMVLAFVVGLWAVRLLLSFGHPVLGVARTLIDEAVRMKIALVFIVGLVLVVPILPVVINPEDYLKYRVRFYLTWSTGAVSLLLSFMTIFLACGTICREIEKKQIYVTMTKPVGRLQYLLGKILGIGLLNVVLVTVAGLGIYTGAKVLAAQPARDASDRQAVDQEIMVARSSVMPSPSGDVDFHRMVEDRLKVLAQEQPSRYGGDEVSPSDIKEIRKLVQTKWLTIAPRTSETYVFRGLSSAAQYTDQLQLQIEPEASRRPADRKVVLGIAVNGRPMMRNGRPVTLPLSDRDQHIIPLPAAAIDDQGEIAVSITNLTGVGRGRDQESSVTFSAGDGMKLYYRVGGFDANLMRSMIVIWLRLLFLGALGIMAGTFLGFPIACLLGLMVYFTAISMPFIQEALGHYSQWPPESLPLWNKIMWYPAQIIQGFAHGDIYSGIKLVVRICGTLFTLLIPSFGRFDVGYDMAQGQLVGWNLIGDGIVWLTGVWTGVCVLIAWLVFRAKELAKVIV
ncbi:MAG: ABC transporter permease [Phycisphaeraceae bacterium]|nr:ABC transporter permease [Phycisphaeraceae bacterium]